MAWRATIGTPSRALRAENRGEHMLLGITLLSIWLIATGLLPLIKVTFANSSTILNVLAVLAGALILLGR